jgi:hypothetical protein
MEAPDIILGGIILLMIAFAIAILSILISTFIIVLLNKLLPFLADKPPKHIPYEIAWIVGVATFAYYIYLFITDPSILE